MTVFEFLKAGTVEDVADVVAKVFLAWHRIVDFDNIDIAELNEAVEKWLNAEIGDEK